MSILFVSYYPIAMCVCCRQHHCRSFCSRSECRWAQKRWRKFESSTDESTFRRYASVGLCNSVETKGERNHQPNRHLVGRKQYRTVYYSSINLGTQV